MIYLIIICSIFMYINVIRLSNNIICFLNMFPGVILISGECCLHDLKFDNKSICK